jgi:hypothetical protein
VRRVLEGVIALGAAALLVACNNTPPPAKTTATAVEESDPRADGDAAAQRHDWTTAAARYAIALQRSPDDVRLRFAYGSVLSQLDRTADTTEQFAWVVEHGTPGSLEVTTARQWLQQAGMVARAPERAGDAADSASRPTRDASAPRTDPRTGLLEGKSSWPSVGPDERTRLSLHMRVRGEDEANKDVRQRLNVEIGTGFTWQRLPPGRYRLIGESKGVTLWDVPVTIDADKTTTVELSPSNSQVPPGTFPPRG